MGRKEGSPNKVPSVSESICWHCARAYAKPDPDGCAFHRKEHEHIFDEAVIGNRAEEQAVIKVKKCQHFKMSDRLLGKYREVAHHG